MKMSSADEAREWLLRNARLSADLVVFESGFRELTGAQQTSKIIERAVEALEANGLIKVLPPEEWPETYVPDPPYERPFW